VEVTPENFGIIKGTKKGEARHAHFGMESYGVLRASKKQKASFTKSLTSDGEGGGESYQVDVMRGGLGPILGRGAVCGKGKGSLREGA